jgi:hypothetical protein
MHTSEPPWKGTVMGGMLLAVLGLLFFAPFFTDDVIFFPVHTATFPPWKEEIPQRTYKQLQRQSTPLMTDKVYIFHPELEFSKKAVRDGRLPLWDPHVLGGIPHLAQGLPGLFDVLNVGYLFMDTSKAYVLTGLLQIVLGSIFMLLFLRALEIRHFAATLGGLAYGFSGWMLLHLHYFMICSAAVWLPLLLLGTEKLMRGARPWWVFALVIGAFQTLCAGFPQIAVMNLYFTVAYALVRATPMIKSGWMVAVKRLALPALGIFLGLLLACAQLLPLAEAGYSEDMTRSMAELDDIRERKLVPACLLTYVVPDLFGHPGLLHRTESPYFKHSSLVSLATLPQRPDMNYLEIQGYVGVVPFILALLVFVARPRRGWIFFAAGAGFSLAVALGIPGILELTSLFPGLLIGDAKRFLFPAAACFAVLSAFTMDACWKPGGAMKVHVVGLVMVAILLVLAGGAWIALAASSDDTLKEKASAAIEEKTGINRAEVVKHISRADLEVQRDHLGASLLKTVLNLVLAGVVLLLTTGWSRDWTVSRPIIVAVLILDLFALGWRFNKPMQDLPLFDADNPVVQFLQENTGEHRILRYGSDDILHVNSGSVLGLRDVQGYTAFYSQRYREILDLNEPGLTNVYGSRANTDEQALQSRLTDLLSVKYILSLEKLELPGLKEVLHKRGVRVYENPDCLPRAFLQTQPYFAADQAAAMDRLKSDEFDPRLEVVIEDAERIRGSVQAGKIAPVKWIEDGAERIEIEVEGGPGWLVLSDPFAAGWEAELDGEATAIHHANLAFRAVKIPDASPHRVTFRYRPDSVHYGSLASLIGLAACLVLIAALFVRHQSLKKKAAASA